MGQVYDPVLIAFANELASTLAITAKAPLTAPPSVRIATRPAFLARAVVGHLLAAEERPSPTAPLSEGSLLEAMRAFFLDPDAQWPSKFQISCWPYLGKESVVIRGFSISAVIHPSYEPITGDLLKFYPLAFFLSDNSPTIAGYKVCKLPLDSPGLHDLTQQVEVPIQGKPPLRWPEAPHSREIMLLSMDRTTVARATVRHNDA